MKDTMKKTIVTLALLLLSAVTLAASGDVTASYTASSKFAASSTTDNFILSGNATSTVYVTSLRFTCTQTTAGIVTVSLIKRSTADTGGTSASVTAVPDDSIYAAAASAPKSYTSTGPTVGTAVGTVDSIQVGCEAPASATENDDYVYTPDKPIVLRGTGQGLALNLGGALTGGNIAVTVRWREVTTQ